MNDNRFHCFGTRDCCGGKLICIPNLTKEEAATVCFRALFEHFRLLGLYENELPGSWKEVTKELFASLFEDSDFMEGVYSTYAGETGVAWPVCYETQPDGTLVEFKFTTDQVFEGYKRYYSTVE